MKIDNSSMLNISLIHAVGPTSLSLLTVVQQVNRYKQRHKGLPMVKGANFLDLYLTMMAENDGGSCCLQDLCTVD